MEQKSLKVMQAKGQQKWHLVDLTTDEAECGLQPMYGWTFRGYNEVETFCGLCLREGAKHV